jgi:hypothetical protein
VVLARGCEAERNRRKMVDAGVMDVPGRRLSGRGCTANQSAEVGVGKGGARLEP